MRGDEDGAIRPPKAGDCIGAPVWVKTYLRVDTQDEFAGVGVLPDGLTAVGRAQPGPWVSMPCRGSAFPIRT
jgi:hypothetical protein